MKFIILVSIFITINASTFTIKQNECIRQKENFVKELKQCQKEVADGKVRVIKIKGTDNPADLMTKVLTVKEIDTHLAGMGLRAKWVGGNLNKINGSPGSNPGS